MELGSDGFLLGFTLRGKKETGIVWVIVEVLLLGVVADADKPSELSDHSELEGFEFRLNGIDVTSGPPFEAIPDEAKPQGMQEWPMMLLPYPGRDSWPQLERTIERMMS